MRPGPKIKSIETLKLEGGYNATRHARRARMPQAEGLLKDSAPPAWLSVGQKRIWREIVRDAPRGVLRKADRRLFLTYVALCDGFEQAVRAQNEHAAKSPTPLLFAGPQPGVSSYLRIMIQCAPRLVQLGAELGLTPVSRRQLGEPERPREPDTDSTWATLRHFPIIQGGKASEGPATSPGRRKNGKKA